MSKVIFPIPADSALTRGADPVRAGREAGEPGAFDRALAKAVAQQPADPTRAVIAKLANEASGGRPPSPVDSRPLREAPGVAAFPKSYTFVRPWGAGPAADDVEPPAPEAVPSERALSVEIAKMVAQSVMLETQRLIAGGMTGGGIAGGGMAGMPGLGGALGGGSSGLAGASSAINTGLMLLALVRRMESREGPSWSSAFPAPGGEAEPIARFRAGSEFDGIVRQAAERFRLPEKLIHAVVKAESAYNPRAKSPAGAMGLMQLMPGTANALGVRDPWDPRANVMGGSLYLRQMIDRYGGDVRRALAAYNWGPGNVDKHGLTRLPDETRGYLARIGGLLREFR